MAATAPPQIVFNPAVPHMNEWAQRTGIPLTTADALGKNYARAHKWLLSLKTDLIQKHGWRENEQQDPRMLINIECKSPLRSSGGIGRTPDMRLQIPLQASSFFTPDRLLQWQMVFHAATFPVLRHDVQPIADLLHLLQCLLTGMLVLVKEEQVPSEGLYKTIRALPPAEWVNAHQALLTEVFGATHFKALFKAASDKRVAFKLEHDPLHQ